MYPQQIAWGLYPVLFSLRDLAWGLQLQEKGYVKKHSQSDRPFEYYWPNQALHPTSKGQKCNPTMCREGKKLEIIVEQPQ